jgi:hypothetical protein
MFDAQLEHLQKVLRNKQIWALNVGENFEISLDAWSKFTAELPSTAVAYLYVRLPPPLPSYMPNNCVCLVSSQCDLP